MDCVRVALLCLAVTTTGVLTLPPQCVTTTTTTPTTTTTTPTTTTTTPTTTTTTPTTTTATPTTTTTTPTTTTTTPTTTSSTATTTSAPTPVQKTIAAMNIQTMGPSKAGKPHIMANISLIMQRYDAICIQEIRDSLLQVPIDLLNAVNNNTQNLTYHMTCSDRLGISTYKEIYCCYIRNDSLVLQADYQYPLENYTVFARPPFCVLLSLAEDPQAAYQLPVCVSHTSPTTACTEIGNFTNVHAAVASHWPNHTSSFLMMGDFNADGSGCSPSNLADKSFYNDTGTYTWLINDTADTTVSTVNHFAYDRMVAFGDYKNNVVSGGAGVFDFMVEYGLSVTEAKAISDHFPVKATSQHFI